MQQQVVEGCYGVEEDRVHWRAEGHGVTLLEGLTFSRHHVANQSYTLLQDMVFIPPVHFPALVSRVTLKANLIVLFLHTRAF